jgi:hypothetical protein
VRRVVSIHLLGVVLLLGTVGCMSMPVAPSPSLHRTLYPGLGDLKPEEISKALELDVNLPAPITGGLAWLSESPGANESSAVVLSEYYRTGVVDEALKVLREEPFSTVANLPTIVSHASKPNSRVLDSLRSAAARFQYDVAFLLQTGAAHDQGLNFLALGYLGLVTVPLIPGDDVGVASSAELCAVDVRTGVMLGCARGRGRARSRFTFRRNAETTQQILAERGLRDAVAAAGADLLGQLRAMSAGR